ncbi:unnamed protein product, partial [Durusdinium trenchii]
GFSNLLHLSLPPPPPPPNILHHVHVAHMTDSSIEERPSFAWGDVQPFVERHFFGAVELVKSLPSERDLNFLVKLDEELAVFKVHNPTDLQDFVECQCLALEHVAQHGACCQRLLRSKSKEFLIALELEGHRRCMCRALSFLPGRMLAEVAQEMAESGERLAQLFDAVGTAVGQVTAALLTFEHAAAEREFVWDLQRCSQVVDAHISDVEEDNRALLQRVLQCQMVELRNLLPRLRRSIVHNDPNDYNLVVNGGQVGVLDFGDMVHSYTCADAAIGMAYLLFHVPSSMPLVEGVLPFVQGFHRACPLEEVEVEALFGLAVCRVCTSLCMSAHQSKLEPDNEYLLISAKPAWRLLTRVDSEKVEHAKDIFKQSLGLQPRSTH